MGQIPLPPQPDDVPWPTERWPEADPGPDVDRERLAQGVSRLLAAEPPPEVGATHALLVVHRGRIVAEGYDAENGPDVPLPSWSMAKSVLHALVGIAVGQGRLDLHAPAAVPAWREAGDPRHAITLDQLLRMTSGLRFDEEYTDLETSSTLAMLFGEGKDDMAAFASHQNIRYRRKRKQGAHRGHRKQPPQARSAVPKGKPHSSGYEQRDRHTGHLRH